MEQFTISSERLLHYFLENNKVLSLHTCLEIPQTEEILQTKKFTYCTKLCREQVMLIFLFFLFFFFYKKSNSLKKMFY